MDEAKEEEDLVEVVDRLFTIIAGCQGTTRGSVRIICTHHVNTALSLTI